MKLEWQTANVATPQDLAATLHALIGSDEFAWLDSPMDDLLDGPPARYGLFSSHPVGILEQYDGQPAQFRVGDRVLFSANNGWELWRQLHDRLPTLQLAEANLSPGWVGYVGFEMARQLEQLPSRLREDLGLPLLRLALYDHAFILDHDARQAQLVWSREIAKSLNIASSFDPDVARDRWNHAVANPKGIPAFAPPRLQIDMSEVDYAEMIERGLDYIAAGDIYQVNLCQRLILNNMPSALSAYAAIRRHNPAPYACLLQWEDQAVISASPELFLRAHGRDILTRPIKGTRPRTGDPTIDDKNRQALRNSAKDAAELAMIIDLHRNDVGRVCKFGSVRVADARRIETHPSVFHTVADIVGTLSKKHDALDALQACFPAGSISGVPKIRSLEIIDELEPFARGIYTGAVGFLGLDEQMTFNVAIRTLQMNADKATLYVGGGIVADSTRESEYAETFDKARGILQALKIQSDPANTISPPVKS